MNRIPLAIYLTHPTIVSGNLTRLDTPLLEKLNASFLPRIAHNDDEFKQALATAKIAVVWEFRQEWFALAPQLRILATPAAGKDYFSVQPPDGVQVVNGRFHGELIGETVVGMILGMTRGLLLGSELMRGGALWPRGEIDVTLRPLRGSRVTILGYGNIGKWIARLLKPFGVQITGIRRNPDKEDIRPKEADAVVGLDRLDDVLQTTEHLVVCLPRNQQSDLLLDARRLALLPAQATLCNVGRGNVLDEDALVTALENGNLRSAFLDVFQEEPLAASSALRQTKNLWILPHVSAFSPNYMQLFFHEFTQRLQAGEFGSPEQL